MCACMHVCTYFTKYSKVDNDTVDQDMTSDTEGGCELSLDSNMDVQQARKKPRFR